MKILPQIIVSYWLLLFTMVNCEWYKNHSQLIDDLDTFFVGLSLLHFFFYSQKYSQTAQYCIKCIIGTLFIHFAYFNFDLNDQTYYVFYGLNIGICLYFCIKQNWNR